VKEINPFTHSTAVARYVHFPFFERVVDRVKAQTRLQKQKRGVGHMFSAKRGASCVRNKIFSFGCRNDAPIRQRRKPAPATAREVIEREVGFQKNEMEIEGRGDVTKGKGWDSI
jgi:hypothetical protein